MMIVCIEEKSKNIIDKGGNNCITNNYNKCNNVIQKDLKLGEILDIIQSKKGSVKLIISKINQKKFEIFSQVEQFPIIKLIEYIDKCTYIF